MSKLLDNKLSCSRTEKAKTILCGPHLFSTTDIFYKLGFRKANLEIYQATSPISHSWICFSSFPRDENLRTVSHESIARGIVNLLITYREYLNSFCWPREGNHLIPH